MKWKDKKKDRQKRLENWHPYFAWLPVLTEEDIWVWLGWCERKVVYYKVTPVFKYRLMQSIEGDSYEYAAPMA